MFLFSRQLTKTIDNKITQAKLTVIKAIFKVKKVIQNGISLLFETAPAM